MERMQKSEIIAFLQCSNIDDVASTVKFTKWKAKLLKMIKEISEIQPRSSTTALSCVQHAKTKQHTSNIGGSRVSASPPIKSTTSVDFPMFTSIPTFQDLIGNTPMIDLSALLPPVVASRGVRVLAKCEFMNPGLSVKDRIMQHIFNKAEARGDLKPGSVVVAASSGNTGAATAMLAAMRGYHAIITTSPKCSKEKMAAIKAYGAELLISNPGLTASDSGHYMNHANKIVNTENNKIRENKTKNKTFWFNVSQYDNPNNPEAHATTLGPEIWKQTCAANIPVTHFVAAGSTGGTISGTSSFLKQKDPSILTTLADPVGSIFTEHFMKLKKQKYSSDSSKNDSNTDVCYYQFIPISNFCFFYQILYLTKK